MNAVHTILYPTDFSAASALAMDVAAALARDQHARLVILHVVPAQPVYTGPCDVSALRRAECAEQDLKTYRDEMGAKLAGLRPPRCLAVEHQLRTGDVAAGIVGAAEATASSVIVMGSHGKTAEARRMLGSVAEAVLKRAPCPAVVVRGRC